MNTIADISYRFLGTWNLDEEKGIIITIRNDNGITSREVRHLQPFVVDCMNLVASGDCIRSPTISNGQPLSDNEIIVGIDNTNMKLVLMISGKDETQIAFDIEEMKIWSADALTAETSKVILREGEREGSLLVQEIFTDHIEGLNFMQYPLPREEGMPVTLKIGETASNGCTVRLTLLEINDGTATFLKVVDENRPCPIC